MQKVLLDAKEGKTLTIKGGLYYSCARFIKKYHRTYSFCKTPYEIITCCYAYPSECGGECCRMKFGFKYSYANNDEEDEDQCGCARLPRNSIHLKNCYDDCCNIVRITNKRKFYLSWHVKS